MITALDSDVELIDLRIQDGNARAGEEGGGGVGIVGGSLLFDNVRLDHNDSWYGGALFAADADVTILDSDFEWNTSVWGGAIYMEGGSLLLEGSEMNSNDATQEIGGISLAGTEAVLSDLQVTNSYSGYNQSAAIKLSGGSLDLSDCMLGSNNGQGVVASWSTLTVSDCEIEGHSHVNGGGFNIEESDATIVDTRIYSGEGVWGAGLWIHASTATLTGVSVEDSGGTYGGGVSISDSSVTITNSVFDSNSSHEGSAITLGGDDTVVSLVDTVVSNNAAASEGAIYQYLPAAVSCSGCSFTGNEPNTLLRYEPDDRSSETVSLDGVTDFTH